MGHKLVTHFCEIRLMVYGALVLNGVSCYSLSLMDFLDLNMLT